MKIECFQEEYPAMLLQIKEYPIQIYCMGNVSLLNNHKTIAIVGSRDSTEYGRKYAKKFAKELSKSNICIISGLALGIDTSAHLGAMKGTGNTIAVLGGGFNDIYPKQNLWLYDEILNNNGCVITEYEENEETRKSNFPKRNRIISGIADAVLVIEASTRSGSKITARYAREQGKKVYCIPKDLDSKNSSGTNELLKEGAKLITTPRQLISDLYNEKIEIEEHNKKQIPEKYEQIYKLIENNLSKEELSIQLDMNMENLNSLLTMMELEGLIEQVPGGRFKRK